MIEETLPILQVNSSENRFKLQSILLTYLSGATTNLRSRSVPGVPETAREPRKLDTLQNSKVPVHFIVLTAPPLSFHKYGAKNLSLERG